MRTWYQGHISPSWYLSMVPTLAKAKVHASEPDFPLSGWPLALWSILAASHPTNTSGALSQMRWSHGPQNCP